jgi:uncharacterized membrane protein YqgA involved in biofilm formation
MMGLGLLTLVLGVDNALEWDATSPLIVFGAVLLGGIVGELIGIERWIGRLGDFAQRKMAAEDEQRRDAGGQAAPGTTVVEPAAGWRAQVDHRFSEGFVTASLLFCVGPLTVVGSIEDGLTGDSSTLVAKALLDGFAAIAFATTLGWGVGLAAATVLIVQGGISLGAGVFEDILSEGSEALAALVSAGGILIIGISLKLLGLRDVKVGNFLPALIFAPALVGVVSLVR